MPRKPRPHHLKKIPVCYRLQRWLVDWMRAQPSPASVAIERALMAHYALQTPETVEVSTAATEIAQEA